MKIPVSTARCFSALLVLSCAFAVSGCLTSETNECRIVMNEYGKGGTIFSIMRNVQSTDADTAAQQKDFESAIDDWKGDEYLLERMSAGVYVKERNLAVEDNVLVWKEKGIFSDLSDVFKHDIKNDTLRLTIKGDQKIVSTNGTTVVGKDSTVVLWRLPVKEIVLSLRQTEFKPKSDFAAAFRAYTKQSH